MSMFSTKMVIRHCGLHLKTTRLKLSRYCDFTMMRLKSYTETHCKRSGCQFPTQKWIVGITHCVKNESC